MSYFQWFKTEGWRQYIVPFSLGIFVNAGIAFNISDVLNGPITLAIAIFTTTAGFDIGIIYHSILSYRNSKQP